MTSNVLTGLQMDDEFLEVNDLDWFASYRDGALAHFATARQGFVPDSVRASMSKFELLYDYFHSLTEVFECEIEESYLEFFESEAKRERYLRSFVSMAKKGLYSYDAENEGYTLIAKPRGGLKLVDLPEEIKAALGIISVDSSDNIKIIKNFSVE